MSKKREKGKEQRIQEENRRRCEDYHMVLDG